MRVPRQQISTYLFNLLSGAYEWTTADQRARVPDDLPADMQPAMFVIKPTERHSQIATFGIPSYRLQYYVFVLFRAGGVPEDVTAEAFGDSLLDSIESTLNPIPGEKQTLGGLVTHCWIEGDVQIDSPVLFEQCAIWIPIWVVLGR